MTTTQLARRPLSPRHLRRTCDNTDPVAVRRLRRERRTTYPFRSTFAQVRCHRANGLLLSWCPMLLISDEVQS